MTVRDRAGGVGAAYDHCEGVVRAEARNFAYGIRLLPAPKRRALSAVYALARRVDDIGDDAHLPVDDKLRRLAAVRAQVAGVRHAGHGRLRDDAPADPVLVALADAADRHPIPLDAFDELIEGCEADVRGTAYASFADLLHYCRCVAGSIGRLSLGVFGTDDRRRAEPLADALGIALQLTNILRDLREDRLAGRVYLPTDDLGWFGCGLELDHRGRFRDAAGDLFALIRFEALRAEDYYATGTRLLSMLDRRSAACAGAMAGIYRRVLDRIRRDPAAPLRGRVSLATWEKAMVAAGALRGRGAAYGAGERAAAR